jgi:hypothetical protein
MYIVSSSEFTDSVGDVRLAALYTAPNVLEAGHHRLLLTIHDHLIISSEAVSFVKFKSVVK